MYAGDAHHGPELREPLLVIGGRGAASEAEVHDNRLASAVDHDVGRLQVAMDDAPLVGLAQGIGDLPAERGNLPVRELLAGRDPLCPVASPR